MGSTATLIFSVGSQVEHSNVRSSNPRVPGEIRAKAILCLHTGHIGRSLTKSPITVPHEIIGKTVLAVLIEIASEGVFKRRLGALVRPGREPVDLSGRDEMRGLRGYAEAP